MTKEFSEAFDALVSILSRMPSVLAVGKTGGAELPEGDESDIDLMVVCDAVPPAEARRLALNPLCGRLTHQNLDADHSPYWGVVDFVSLCGVEVCLMYHELSGLETYCGEVRRGERMEKEGGYFYSTGRIASLIGLHTYFDRGGLLARLVGHIRDMPEPLADRMFFHHLAACRDREDFSRAVSRKDPLFYHFVMENALDHFLQALFALNRAWFPAASGQFSTSADFPANRPDAANGSFGSWSSARGRTRFPTPTGSGWDWKRSCRPWQALDLP